MNVEGESQDKTLEYKWKVDGVEQAGDSSIEVTARKSGEITVIAIVQYKDKPDVKKESVEVFHVMQKEYLDISVDLTSQTLEDGYEITATAVGEPGVQLAYKWDIVGDAGLFGTEITENKVKVTTKEGSEGKSITLKVTVSYEGESSNKPAQKEIVVTNEAVAFEKIKVEFQLAKVGITAGNTAEVQAIISATKGKDLVYEWSKGNEYFELTPNKDKISFKAGIDSFGKELPIKLRVSYNDEPGIFAEAEFVLKAHDAVVLKTTEGLEVYVLEGEQYRVATSQDYNKNMKFYIKNEGYKYTGWQTLDGKVYYYDATGKYIVGDHVIQGAKYSFNSDGSLKQGAPILGIDVSRYNVVTDWNAVKAAGVKFVIIRTGFRGYGTGVLVEDSKFRAYIQGAKAAGLQVGVYFFSQAIDEREAVEEASMVLGQVAGYNLEYPIYIDVEYSNPRHNGRADGLSVADRTKVVNAFCQTVQNSGYKAGVYANKSWLETMLDMSQLNRYDIWLAQYAKEPTYGGSYNMWQYSDKGTIGGIQGGVDMNLRY